MASPKTWTRNGTMHQALSRCAASPATFKELAEVTGHLGKRRRHKFWFKLSGPLDAGLLTFSDGLYDITPAGLDRLDELGGPVSTGAPSVRIFARAA